MNRRRFFREGLRHFLRPLASSVEPIAQAAKQLGRLETQTVPRSVRLGQYLRPPGAMEESRFGQTCTRGGECVKVCPAPAIKIDPSGQRGGGFPYIDADAMACVVCDGLYCMHACPSGALALTAVGEIDMGTAVWHESLCVRSTGDSCTICIDHCPIGSVAIELRENKVHVIEDGCIGCGVCQHDCPTHPKAIVVRPRPVR